MKKSNINYLVTVLLSVVILSSCGGLSKMVKMAPEVRYSVSPEILEMHADSVEITLNGSFPAKYFNKNAELTVTPVLKYDKGEVLFASKQLQGDAVQANNTVISSVSGGSFSHTAKIAYTDDMRISNLELKIVASMKGQSVDIPSVKVADGVLATAGLAENDAKSIMAADKFVRITTKTEGADIHYIINRAEVRNSELRSDDIKALKTFIEEASKQENYEFTGVEISAYASPDGTEELNTKLADKRSVSAEKYLGKTLKKLKVEGTKEEGFYTTKATPEDWEGFKKLMEASDIQDKEIILRVLQMNSDPVVREKEIKNLAAAYEVLKVDILPQLRRSMLNVNINIVGYSDSLLTVFAKENPDTLTKEELLYAATLTSDADEKLAIYKVAAKNFTDDWRGPNNVGYLYILKNNLTEAENAFNEAKKINESNTTVLNNLGVVAYLNNDFEKAKEYYNSAAGAGREVGYNQAIISLREADYEGAATLFGSDCSFNVALVKLLNNNNTDACLGKIKCSDDPEAGKMYYLKAIVGARTQNSDLLYNSLRTAVEKDPSLAGLAITDMEFAKYFEDGTFKSIVE
ncbi:MAG: hypothetical protein KAT68_11140 [Bacteroidales bacterium]|nr:hypothetical protein [Bacteroidales bacterium]